MIGKVIAASVLTILCASVFGASDPAFDFAAVSAQRFPAPPSFADAVSATNYSHRFELPHSTGGVWRLSFDYALDHFEGDRISGARAIVQFGPRIMPWGPDRRGLNVTDSGADANALYPWRYELKVFPGMKFMDLNFDMTGKGDFRVANVRFEEIPLDVNAVTLELPFCGYFDGTFHIGSGQAGLPVFFWRTRFPEETPPERFGCRISLSPGFSFVDASNADLKTLSVTNYVDGSSMARYRVDACGPSFSRTGGTRFGVVVRSDCPPGTEGMMMLFAEVDGDVASAPISLRLVSAPPVKVESVPKSYANAAYLGGEYSVFHGEGSRMLARPLHDAGVTWLIPGVAQVTNNPALVPMWREEGMRRITPDGSRIVANGFNADGEVHCPCALYGEDSQVRARLRKVLKESLVGCDGMWSNWEPYAYTGCRKPCDKCAAAEKGLDDAALLQLRSSEHGRVVAAVAEDVAAVTGSSVGFIPGIYWPELGPGHEDFRFTREIRTECYAGGLSYLNAFGPYVRWTTAFRYVPEPGRALAYFCVARETMRQVENDYPPEERPALMAFPLGLSGREWASSPEWLELALDSFFFNGWSCVAPWSFPSGGDARFLAAFARATELSAKWEDFVWNGARADRAVRVKARGSVRTRSWIDRTYLSKLRDVPLLQHAAWEKGGERIVALFNFDESNSVVCDVSLLSRTETVDVPPSSCRVVHFPRRR